MLKLFSFLFLILFLNIEASKKKDNVLSNNEKKPIFLIIGVGEVGTNLVQYILKTFPSCKINIHTLTKSSAVNKMKMFSDSRVSYTFGNIFELYLDPQGKNIKTESFFNSPRFWYKNSSIYRLIENHKPDYIVDTIPLALCFKNVDSHNDTTQMTFVSIISSFIQSLRKALEDFNVKHYVKVSTSGLGGMGFRCPYSHGTDVRLHKIHSSLENKIASSGIFHQFLWNLKDTLSQSKISLIIPKAMIIGDDPILKKSNNLIDSDEKSMVVIPSGDSSFYSQQEFLIATTQNQFGAISKYEVVYSIMDSLFGYDSSNVLGAMELASLKGSIYSYLIREKVLKKASNLISIQKKLSIVTGNLGPYISKLICEVFILKNSVGSIAKLASLTNKEIADSIKFYLAKNKYIKKQILLSGLDVDLGQRREPLKEGINFSEKPENLRKISFSSKNISNWKKFFKEKNIDNNFEVDEIVNMYLESKGLSRIVTY